MRACLERVSKTEAFMLVAQQLGRLSSCCRRHVGCVLTDEQNRIVACGYNGAPTKVDHCGLRCEREGCGPGEKLELCLAIHAEANALMHCPDIKRIHACYIWGATPCWECAKLLCNSSVKRVFASSGYTAENDTRVIRLFERRGIDLTVVSFADEVKARGDEPPRSFTTRDLC